MEPPSAEDDHSRPDFHALGPGVAALVISPRVRARVSHEVFDHASITKTCLVRFCRREDGLIPDMGAQVSATRHLGVLLDPDVRIAPDRTT